MTQLQVLQKVMDHFNKVEITTPKELYDLVFSSIEGAKVLPPFGEQQPGKNFGPLELNQTEAILGFLSFLSGHTQGVTYGSNMNPGNLDALVVLFSNANHFSKMRPGWQKLLSWPEN